MAFNKAVKTVQTTDASRDLQSKNADLVADTSTTIATLLGVAVSANARGVEIYPSGTVHYNPDGAATTGHAILPAVKTVYGSKAELDTIQVIGASGATPNVSVIVFGDK